MSIAEIENEIKKLSTDKVNKLMEWFADYHAELWDRQIAEDADAGRFESVFAEVDSEIAAGLAKPL